MSPRNMIAPAQLPEPPTRVGIHASISGRILKAGQRRPSADHRHKQRHTEDQEPEIADDQGDRRLFEKLRDQLPGLLRPAHLHIQPFRHAAEHMVRHAKGQHHERADQHQHRAGLGEGAHPMRQRQIAKGKEKHGQAAQQHGQQRIPRRHVPEHGGQSFVILHVFKAKPSARHIR